MEHHPIERLDRRVAEIYRRMTPTERIALVLEGNDTMRTMLNARLRGDHPDWTDRQIADEIARRFLV